MQLTRQSLSAEHKNCTGADGDSRVFLVFFIAYNSHQ